MKILSISLVVVGLIVLSGAVHSLKATPIQKYETELPVLTEDKTIQVYKGPTDTVKSSESKKLRLKELDLSGNRQVYIEGVIDYGNSILISKQILYLGKTPEPITIIIDSPGGSVVAGAAIISAMEAAKGPVNTVCVQLCASMAALIHQYGTHRYMINRALVMFHPASGSLDGEVDKMASRLGTLKKYIGRMENNAARRAHLTYEQYKCKSGVEMWLEAEDAVNEGFADNIVFVRGANAEKLYPNISFGLKLGITPSIKFPFNFNYM